MENKDFQKKYFEQFGTTISEKNTAFPIIKTMLEVAWGMDQKSANLGEAIETIEEYKPMIEKLSETSKIKLVISDKETANSWWHGKRHFMAMLSIIGCIILASISYGIFEYTKSGRISNFYNISEKETIDNTVYVILKPSKSDFVIGKNCIILDNGSIAVPIHEK